MLQKTSNFYSFKQRLTAYFHTCRHDPEGAAEIDLWHLRKSKGQNGGCIVLGRFAKLRKVVISFVVSVRLSVRIEHLGSHWKDFDEILYFRLFRKSVDKIQV